VALDPLGRLVVLAAGLLCAGAGLVALLRRSREQRWGHLVAIDAGRPQTLRSERLGLVGRPDALRRRRDGALVPIELKHRPAPTGGPFRSHRVQLAAYCLLVEETTGRAPPFGVLRYADAEFALPWDDAARALATSTLAAVRRPYDGRADPAPQKCAGCRWSPGCDASLAATARGHRPSRDRPG
jgi:CRISPR-associated exonuclease Cas4